MSKFTNVRVSTRAAAVLVAAKTSQVRDDLKVAKNMTEQDLVFEAARKAQERLDNKVLKIANDIESTDAKIASLQELREQQVAALESAKNEAESFNPFAVAQA